MNEHKPKRLPIASVIDEIHTLHLCAPSAGRSQLSC